LVTLSLLSSHALLQFQGEALKNALDTAADQLAVKFLHDSLPLAPTVTEAKNRFERVSVIS
jgi:hypothetical protein